MNRTKLYHKVCLPVLFLLPITLLFFFFKFMPIFKAISVSFVDYNFVHPHLSEFVGLRWYRQALADPTFRLAWLHSCYATVLSILLGFWVPVILSIFINEITKGQTFFRIAFYIPVITSMVAVAYVWKWLYNPEAGFFNMVFSYLGLPSAKWLNSTKMAMPCIIVMGIWKNVGGGILIYLAALQGVPGTLYEAAELDGASFTQKITNITLPSLYPVMIIMLILNVIGSLQIFEEVFLMTQGGPIQATEVIAHYIYNTAFRDYEMGYATAMSILLFLALIVVTYFQMKYMMKEKK